MQEDIQRALGRVEATLDAHGRELGEIKDRQDGFARIYHDDMEAIRTWQTEHQRNHHGRHGRGPGGVVNRQNIQTTGLLGALVAIYEVLRAIGILG
ncbi:hypothetical protein LCGC14_1816850 [marine sediment metagenome]|uniref:Uncharacterized protein n=1 Tax=marine sediment metagenome TaxID=412755 RepID=A0A0F9GK45_9ZZZZ